MWMTVAQVRTALGDIAGARAAVASAHVPHHGLGFMHARLSAKLDHIEAGLAARAGDARQCAVHLSEAAGRLAHELGAGHPLSVEAVLMLAGPDPDAQSPPAAADRERAASVLREQQVRPLPSPCRAPG